MKKISIAIALVISVLVYFMQEEHTDELVLENVEALSAGDTPPNIKKVTEIFDIFDEDTVDEPEYDNEGRITKWKKVVVSVVHNVICGETKGTVTCIPRKDYHSPNNPDFCPYNH